MLRNRQVRNLIVALLISAGTLMLWIGDEHGHSRQGNNNAWCQDGVLSWFDWQQTELEQDKLIKFVATLVRLRTSCKTLQRDRFLNDLDVVWHGVEPNVPDWNSLYNFIALTLRGDVDIYVAFNCGNENRGVQLPHKAEWGRVIDTNLEAECAVPQLGQERRLEGGSRYDTAPHSVLV